MNIPKGTGDYSVNLTIGQMHAFLEDDGAQFSNAISTAWEVYDSCAEWCAKRGLKGTIGDPLPNLLSGDVLALINDDPEAFERRVRETAYALAMSKSECEHDHSDLGHVWS